LLHRSKEISVTDQVLRNAASRDRIRALGERVAAGPVRPVDDDGGWGPAVVLAHLAFWDAVSLARWQQAGDDGLPAPLASNVADLVNPAAFPQWAALDVETATRLALEAAAAVDAYLEALPPERAEAARAAGLGRQVDRSLHRNEHLDAAERAL
jgi:hypothetical protein